MKRKTPKNRPARAHDQTAATAPVIAPRLNQYRPEVREFAPPIRLGHTVGRRTFPIIDKATGATMATVTVNDALDADSCEAFERLFTYSPELWRALFDETRMMLMDPEDMFTRFPGLACLLWDACGRGPFDPAIVSMDQELYESNTDAAAKALAARQGIRAKAAKAVAHV